MIRLLPKRLRIPPNALVLEIGSGGRPHSRSNILLDRYLDPMHREGKALVHDRRPLVLADGEALPFKDKAFGYCICQHVLEHTRHPERLLAEMQRVAHAGYIETPTELFDWMFAVAPYTEIHLWFVNLVQGELVLSPKHAANSRHRFAQLFDCLRREDPFFERWMEKRPELFTVQYEWKDTIRYRFADSPPGEALEAAQAAREWLSPRCACRDFYWGSGLWGLKRWLYANAVHPLWRKRAKRLASWLRGKDKV